MPGTHILRRRESTYSNCPALYIREMHFVGKNQYSGKNDRLEGGRFCLSTDFCPQNASHVCREPGSYYTYTSQRNHKVKQVHFCQDTYGAHICFLDIQLVANIIFYGNERMKAFH